MSTLIHHGHSELDGATLITATAMDGATLTTAGDIQDGVTLVGDIQAGATQVGDIHTTATITLITMEEEALQVIMAIETMLITEITAPIEAIPLTETILQIEEVTQQIEIIPQTDQTDTLTSDVLI